MARQSYLKLGVEIAAHSITLGYTVFSGTQAMQFIEFILKDSPSCTVLVMPYSCAEVVSPVPRTTAAAFPPRAEMFIATNERETSCT